MPLLPASGVVTEYNITEALDVPQGTKLFHYDN
jgi:hypothetical protein